MKKKRLLSLLLAGAMAFSMAACGGQETVTNDQNASSAAADAASEPAPNEELKNQLIIGTVTQMESEFYDTSFSAAGTNYIMYDLIHGYDTVISTKEGAFEYDPTVVASHEEVDNEDGSRMHVGKKYRGKMERCLIEYVHNKLEGRTDLDLRRVFITHSGSPESDIQAVRREVARIANFREIYITRANCTISTHCGPRTLGVLFMTK